MSSEYRLLNSLNNTTQTLHQALELAENKFTAVDFHLVKNRELILIWLKSKYVDKNISNTEQKLILSTLNKCIVTSVDVLFNPQLAIPILEILSDVNQHLSEILECSVEVLKNTHFLKYFVYNVQKLSQIINSCVKRAKSADIITKENVYRNILKSIVYIKDHSLQSDELKLAFVNLLMGPIATIAYNSKKHRLLQSESELICDVFYRVLFMDVEFRILFANNILSSTKSSESGIEKLVSDVIHIIKMYPTHLKPRLVCASYTLIFRGFLTSNANCNAKFSVLVALCSFIYVCPISLDENNIKYVMFKENIKIVNEFLGLLLNFDISLDSKLQSITFMDWLKALIDVTLENIMDNFRPSVILLLKNTLSFSPLLMEDCLRKFVKNVMVAKKSDPQVVKAYSDLCLDVLNVHIKLNRMHKLISALLITVKESLSDLSSEEMPCKFDLLPEEMFGVLQSAVTNLPSTVQSMALLNSLLYHLENDCIAVLECQNSKQIESKQVLMFDIVTYLISRFIKSSRVMDYSIPDVVKHKFILLMDNLGDLLRKFGNVVISKEHNPELVECYLHICHVWGAMQILFMTYESVPRKIVKQTGIMENAATNLVYLHPYLSDYHWKLIAQRVANFGNENCTNLMNDLVLQKIHALPYMEDEIQGPFEENIYSGGPAAVCAHYLSNQASPKWIFHHITEFVHLLNPVDTLKLSKALVNYCQSCENEEILQIISTDFQEMRTLVMAMLNYTFHSLSKTLDKINLKEMKRILREIDYEEVIRVERDDDPPVESFKLKLEVVAKILSNDFQFLDEQFNINSIRKDIFILSHLPARYLRSESKVLICMLTLSLIKSLIMLQLNNVTESEIFIELSKFLQGVLSGICLPMTLDYGKVLAWFYRGLKKTPYCDITMRRLCEANYNFGSEVDSVIEIVRTANSVFVENSAEGIDLISSYLVNFEKICKRKYGQFDNEVEEKLKRICYENIDQVFLAVTENKEHRDKQLALYNVLLLQALKFDDHDELRFLSAHLNSFIIYTERNYESECEVVSRFLLILVCHFKKLKLYLPHEFLLNTWSCRWFVSGDNVLSAFLKASTVEEYKEMVYLLLANTEGALHVPDLSQLDVLYRAWKSVFGTSVKENKCIVRKNLVLEFSSLVEQYILLREPIDSESDLSLKVRRMFIQTFIVLIRNSEIKLCYRVVDLCFDLVSTTLNCFLSVEVLIECIELLFVFCVLKKSLLLDRIPSFYLCYKSLYAEVVRRAQIQDSELVVPAAHKLEKLTDNLMKSRKDFIKTAISAVSDLISVIIEVKLEGTLETHLKNIIYCWIGMCDLHGLQYLSTALSPNEQNLFKQYWADYKKFYKFSGKV